MDILLREATIEDARGKGYVHYQAWNETYTGLINQSYLDARTLDQCIKIAKRHSENTIIAIIDDVIVGFACYNKSRDDDLANCGEIYAIYVLKKYHKLGVGKKLMEACYEKLNGFEFVSVWVLKSNVKSIKFYEHLGFRVDGKQKVIKVSDDTELHEIRLIKNFKAC